MFNLEEMIGWVKRNEIPADWFELEEKNIEEQAIKSGVDKQYMLYSRYYALASSPNGGPIVQKYKKLCLDSIKNAKLSDWKAPEADTGFSPLMMALGLRDSNLLAAWLLALQQGRVPQFMIDWVITDNRNKAQGINALYHAIYNFNMLQLPDDIRQLYKKFALELIARSQNFKGICQGGGDEGFTSLIQAIRSEDIDLITACTNAVKAGKADQEMICSIVSDDGHTFQGVDALYYVHDAYNNDDNPQALKDCCKGLILQLIESSEKLGGILLQGQELGDTAFIQGLWTEDTEIVNAWLSALRKGKVEQNVIDSRDHHGQNALQIALDFCKENSSELHFNHYEAPYKEIVLELISRIESLEEFEDGDIQNLILNLFDYDSGMFQSFLGAILEVGGRQTSEQLNGKDTRVVIVGLFNQIDSFGKNDTKFLANIYLLFGQVLLTQNYADLACEALEKVPQGSEKYGSAQILLGLHYYGKYKPEQACVYSDENEHLFQF